VALIVALSSVLASQPATAASQPRNGWEAIQPLLNSGNLNDAKKAIIITLGPVLIGTGSEGMFSNAVSNPTNIACISAELKVYLDKYATNKQMTSSVSTLARVAASPLIPMGPYGPLIKQYFKSAQLSMGAVSKIGKFSQARAAAANIATCF
jgi:hypothetical protein